jgi:hypothetical protein
VIITDIKKPLSGQFVVEKPRQLGRFNHPPSFFRYDRGFSSFPAGGSTITAVPGSSLPGAFLKKKLIESPMYITWLDQIPLAIEVFD